MTRTSIRDAVPGDAEAIASIYNAYVRDSTATFELEPVATAAMQARIADVQARGLPWLVVECDGELLGYAYATPWKARAAYARSVETSIYLAMDATGRGLGRPLYAQLVERLHAAGLHALIGGITLPNPASVALHEALGFVHVGSFREVGFKQGRWIDVGYWQRVLPGTRDA
jgi:L-amino acid N-acyltransferase YncA